MKHTKGQWKIRHAIPQENLSIKIKSDDIIAVGVDVDNDSKYTAIAFCGDFEKPEAMANAKLIAAAPDMLEALISMKGVMPFHDGDFTLGESNAMYKCEEAIKKATK